MLFRTSSHPHQLHKAVPTEETVASLTNNTRSQNLYSQRVFVKTLRNIEPTAPNANSIDGASFETQH